jgi:hypothetical protein
VSVAARVPLIVLALALTACQSSAPRPATSSGKSAALNTMERVATAAQTCWFVSKDPAFQGYRMANELNSFSGRPRILLVPAKSPEARPLLVVQAEGTPARVDAFGPVMDGESGARIANDIRRWTSGNSACA